MLLIVLIFIITSVQSQHLQLCNSQPNFSCKTFNNENEVCIVRTTDNCRKLIFTNGNNNNNLKNDFGDVFLELKSDLLLSINVYPTIEWNNIVMIISKYNNPNICQTYVINGANNNFKDLFKFDCSLKDDLLFNEAYLLEINSEYNNEFGQKQILFNIPNRRKNKIFAYIDFTNPSKLILKIQPSTEIYHKITHYKVEVYREKENRDLLLDVRLIVNEEKKSLNFEYFTYNEMGDYYFVISEISNYCPEDVCDKTVTPRIHISRKGRPLIIGIVGASFLIPFALFFFYWWNYKYRNPNPYLSEPIKKLLILYKPSFDKHNEVISSLIKNIEYLSSSSFLIERINLQNINEKTFCSDNLILATHIIYVNPLLIDSESSKLDSMTLNFLKEATSTRKLLAVRLPYSKVDFPEILLKNALVFDLIQDYPEFIRNFTINNDYNESNPIYVDFIKKIELATQEVDYIKNIPNIVVTDDGQEEAREIDDLIPFK